MKNPFERLVELIAESNDEAERIRKKIGTVWTPVETEDENELLQKALRGAIKLDIENAEKSLKMNHEEHARCLRVLCPNIAKFILAFSAYTDMKEAEAN
jgi:hypothetical protein